jgi:hypothetical protein
MDERDFCIQSDGGLLDISKESVPEPERTNGTVPSFRKPRSILDPAGLLRDDNAL